MGTPGRIQATYQMTAATRRVALARARDLVVEQTVEVPAQCVPTPSRAMVGVVERVERAGAGRWRAHCWYDAGVVGDSVPQLFNLLFGNVSLFRGVRLVDLRLDQAALPALPGPAFGVKGLRRLCGVTGRPLLCVAAKPIGLSARELGAVCYQFAAAGTDIVKDDHGLSNQAPAPFRERVARCQDAVTRANAETGGGTLYFPNLSRGGEELWEDLDYLRSLGCRGVLMSPMLTGPDAVRAVAARGGVAVLSHPTFTGALLQGRHGIAPEILFGVLFRAIGSDGVIYPNAGGRFPLSLATCRAINQRLRGPLGALRAAFPVAGGGVSAERVPYWIRQYGPDTMFLVSSSLYAQRDTQAATARLVESIQRSSQRSSHA
jgi:ribulose-bisphosphate carboxylase large chain